jgi:hypothetical protein
MLNQSRADLEISKESRFLEFGINPLYSKVATGGFIIVDDYHSCPPCKRAIDDFRAAQGISDDMFCWAQTMMGPDLQQIS